MSEEKKDHVDLLLPPLASLSTMLIYPAFIKPIGPLSNCGVTGVLLLVFTSSVCWLCFFSNISKSLKAKVIKFILAIPITAITIYETGLLLAYYDVYR